ncbi:hypothetical protein WR25_09483 [Diploscapter pachys]|uniref:Peptidase A2 domain-containing protein n=1 Tax=Diploscapter pachys TaxID=2018661 RepID=A0A2A2LN07_9BILA|nr:hypothetical protein WR25_09483 [Diploscapter pachys]
MTENKKASWLNDPCERLAIPPDMHEMMFRDIDKQGLAELGDQEGIVNLSPTVFPSVAFPADGVIYSESNRLMVCLPCRHVRKPAATVNVWFIVDTGSNWTFLAKETIEALICKDDPFPRRLRVAIGDPNSEIECNVSPPEPEGHFEDANVLGMLALRYLKLSVVADWKKDRFKLIKQ